MTKRAISGKIITRGAHEAALLPEKPLLFGYRPSTATNYAENARKTEENGFYGQVFADFRTFSRSTNLTGWKTAKNSNKGLHRTAHKLPHLHGLAMIQPVEATHYFACALSGEP